MVWAAGVQESSLGAVLAARSGATLDAAGRVQVERDLTLPGHPDVFVVGDLARLDDLPCVAQVAIQGARYAARTITARVDAARSGGPTGGRIGHRQPASEFRYHDKGSMAAVSRTSAVVSVGRIKISGRLAWLMWLGLHLFYLLGIRHRLSTLLHWAFSFVGRRRSERVVTVQQGLARQASPAGVLPSPRADEAARRPRPVGSRS